MNITYIQDIIKKVLENDELVKSVDMTQDVMFMQFVDGTSNSIIIRETKLLPFEDNEVVNEFTATHTQEEFVEYVQSLLVARPGVYCLLLIMQKLDELGIISFNSQHEIISSVSGHEKELDDFFSRLLLGKRDDSEKNLSN